MIGNLLFPESANYPDTYKRHSKVTRGGLIYRTNVRKNLKVKPTFDMKDLMKDPEFVAVAKEYPEILRTVKNAKPATPEEYSQAMRTEPEETPIENPLARKDD